jgi:putative transposase
VPRQPRIIVPGQPLHITHRGNNRMTIFLDAADFDKCWSLLRSASKRHRCGIHAYVFMDNHVHMLVTPADIHGPAKFMQSFGDSYALYFNRNNKRTGTLWEGRYKSHPVETERYFYDCSRYIEMNPVRAMMAPHPGAYPRSSFLHNAMGVTDSLVTPHPLYESLGQSELGRRLAYQELFKHHLDSKVCDAIRRAMRTGNTLGDESASS